MHEDISTLEDGQAQCLVESVLNHACMKGMSENMHVIKCPRLARDTNTPG
jgi:hypothetical protein